MDRGHLNKANTIGFAKKPIFELKLWQIYLNLTFEIQINLKLSKQKTKTTEIFYMF